MIKKRMNFNLKRKFILGFTLLAGLLCVVLCVFTALIYRGNFENQYTDYAFLCARMISETVDGDRALGYINGSPQDNYYDEIYNYLSAVMTYKSIRYAYIFVPTIQNGVEGGLYIWNVPAADEKKTEDHKAGFFSPFWDTSDSGSTAIIKRTYEKGETIDNVYITNSSDGYIASAYCPIFGSDNKVKALVGVDINMNDITAQLESFVLRLAGMIILTVVVFLSVYLVFLTHTLIMPIRQLTDTVSGFVSGGKLSQITNTVHTGDELQLLCEAFCSMAGDIRTYSDNLASSAADRERVNTELAVAKNIQLSMLPSTYTVLGAHPEFDIFAEIHPAQVVGGDFYDFFMLDENRLGICIADIAGKGVSAALMMVIAKTLIKYHMQSGETLPEVLAAVNRQLCENNAEGLYVTALVGILELGSGRFTYVNAGHTAPYLMRNGEHYERLTSKNGFVLAYVSDVNFRDTSVTLRQGDRLFMTTSGLYDAAHGDEIYGDSSLTDSLNATRSKSASLNALTGSICGEAIAFAGGKPHDDITALALEYRKGSREMREMTLSASEGKLDELLAMVRGQLDENGIAASVASRVTVLLETAYMVVAAGVAETGDKKSSEGDTKTSTSGSITVSCTVDGEPPSVGLKFIYGSTLYDPDTADEPAMQLIRRQSDNVTSAFENGHNMLTIIKKL